MVSCGNLYLDIKGNTFDDICVCIQLDELEVGDTTSLIDSRALISAGVPLGGQFSYSGNEYYTSLYPIIFTTSGFPDMLLYDITRLDNNSPTLPPIPSPTTTTKPLSTKCVPCMPMVPSTPNGPPPIPNQTTKTSPPTVIITTIAPTIDPLSTVIKLIVTSTTTSIPTTTTTPPKIVIPVVNKVCESVCNKLGY